MENTNKIHIVLDCPVKTPERFARDSGLSEGQMRSMLDRRLISFVKFGRLRMVNVARITTDCLSDEEV